MTAEHQSKRIVKIDQHLARYTLPDVHGQWTRVSKMKPVFTAVTVGLRVSKMTPVPTGSVYRAFCEVTGNFNFKFFFGSHWQCLRVLCVILYIMKHNDVRQYVRQLLVYTGVLRYQFSRNSELSKTQRKIIEDTTSLVFASCGSKEKLARSKWQRTDKRIPRTPFSLYAS